VFGQLFGPLGAILKKARVTIELVAKLAVKAFPLSASHAA
jgi:hypothetical protein